MESKSPVLKLSLSGPIPSFKTGKRGTIATTPEGKMYGRTVTQRPHKLKMQQLIRDIVSQLSCASGQEGPILTDKSRQSLIAWLGPLSLFDDSGKWIGKFVIDVELVEAGHEGAEITIEEICPTKT